MQDVKVVISESHACTVVSYRANNTQYFSSGINSLKSVLVALSAMTRFSLATCVCCWGDRLRDNSGGSNWRSAGQCSELDGLMWSLLQGPYPRDASSCSFPGLVRSEKWRETGSKRLCQSDARVKHLGGFKSDFGSKHGGVS